MVATRTLAWPSGAPYETSTTAGSNTWASTWYYAEGGKGGFSTYLALLNPLWTDTTVTVTYFHDNGQIYTQSVPLPGVRRVTVSPPAAMPDGGFAMQVQSAGGAPFLAERSIYFGPGFDGGDTSAGWFSAGTTWRFVNGRVDGPFDTYFLLFNPSSTAAAVTLVFLKSDGTPVPHTVTVPAQRRLVVSADAVPGLAGSVFWTYVASTNGVGIVAERAMFWPAGGWGGSHVAVGR